jgi:homoserine acetyltransferase
VKRAVKGWAVAPLLAAALSLLLPAAVLAREPVTGEAAIPSLAPLKRYGEVRGFRLGGRYDLAQPPSTFDNGGRGGVTLESLGAPPVALGYIAVGTPERNDKGEITNGVVIATYGAADATSIYAIWFDGQPGTPLAEGAVVGPGRLIDTNKLFVVFVDGLGLWGSAKPSAGLGPRFPAYSFFDSAQLTYRLLRDHLRFARLRLAAGVSQGGAQAYLLAAMHPEFVEAILPIGAPVCSSPAAPALYWLHALSKAAIEADPVWLATGGRYYDRPKAEHPNGGVMFAWSILGLASLEPHRRAEQPWTQVRREVFGWSPSGEEAATLKQRAAEYDAVDLHHRANAAMAFCAHEWLPRIRARTLIFAVETDRLVPLAAAREAASAIAPAMLLSFAHPLGHFATFAAPNRFKDEVRAFVEDRFLPRPPAPPR